MTLKELTIFTKDLANQVKALASRRTVEKADNAKAKAIEAKNKAEALDAEVADMFLAMAEMITGGEENE